MEQTQKKNYTLPIIMMFALFAMISFVTGLTNPLGVIVKNQFSVANWMSQLGNAANFIAYAFMGLPAGLMLKRIGYKKTALVAIAVGFIGVGIQFLAGEAGSFGIYLAGAFISGFSMCMLNTVVNPMLNTLGGGGKKGNQLIQFGGSLNSIAATIVPILVGYLMGNAANATISDASPALFIAMGIFALVFVVMLAVNIPEPYAIQEAKSEKKDKYSALSFRHFVLGTVAIFIYVGVEVGIPNFMNLFMTTKTTSEAALQIESYKQQQADPEMLASLKSQDEAAMAALEAAGDKDGIKRFVPQVISEDDYKRAEKVVAGEIYPGLGMNAGIAGVIVGLYWLLMMCGRLIGGAIGGKVSSKLMLTFVSSLGLILVFAAMFTPVSNTIKLPDLFGGASVPLSIVFLVLCGLCTSVMWGGIFNLAVEGIGKYTSMGSGIFMMMVCGGGIIPLIQGYVADIAGYLASYWVIIVALAFLLYYALIGSKNVNKDIPVD